MAGKLIRNLINDTDTGSTHYPATTTTGRGHTIFFIDPLSLLFSLANIINWTSVQARLVLYREKRCWFGCVGTQAVARHVSQLFAKVKTKTKSHF